MTECPNIDVREQLPEFVAGILPAGERDAIEEHLALCAACRAESEMLAAVRAARPVPPVMNIAAIVAALPKPAETARETSDTASADTVRAFRVITGGEPALAPSLRTARRKQTSARRWPVGASVMRFAAAITLVAVGGLSFVMARSGPVSLTDGDTVAVSDMPADLMALSMPYAPGTAPVVAVVSVAPSVLPIQELSDYTEDELTLLLEQLDAWDGAPPVDAPPLVPPMMDTMLEEVS